MCYNHATPGERCYVPSETVANRVIQFSVLIYARVDSSEGEYFASMELSLALDMVPSIDWCL